MFGIFKPKAHIDRLSQIALIAPILASVGNCSSVFLLATLATIWFVKTSV